MRARVPEGCANSICQAANRRRYMLKRAFVSSIICAGAAIAAGCGNAEPANTRAVMPTSLSEVPAVQLNYRYEPDVPEPEVAPAAADAELQPAVRAHFEGERPGELLDRTLTSPDGARVLAIYHKETDLPAEFRLDMYGSDGRMIQKITADTMAVHFPDTIVWSPDSTHLAFVAMIRGAQGENPDGTLDTEPTPTPGAEVPADANANTDANLADPEANAMAIPAEPDPLAEPTPTAPLGVLTFRTEQIYLCNADGGALRPLTQNEGLIYFYYAWSPDSTMLAALAATAREWQYLERRAQEEGQIFIPVGRPRIVERNGRERRLDDGMTAVQPVWSPDSAKVAAGYDTQVRVYDAVGAVPTQAAVPLRNALLLSSQAFDMSQQQQLGADNAADANAQPPQPTTLPDPATLVSFNPIVGLEWTSPDILYFQTAFIRRMQNEADSVSSFPRWHRLIFSPQPPAGQPQQPAN